MTNGPARRGRRRTARRAGARHDPAGAPAAGRGFVGIGLGRRVPVIGLVLVLAVLAAGSGCSLRRGAAGPPGETVVIRGSDTLVNLCAAWAEAFMASGAGVEVSVAGGGSSAGFAALIDGSADLGSASRPIKEVERRALEAKGRPPVPHVVAVDAVAVVVNPLNPVRSLTLAQLADLLTGRVRNWRGVGGPDLPVTVYSRETSSGTFAFVKEMVTGGEDFVSSARLMPATRSILIAVAQDRGGLGYVGLGYVTPEVRALALAPAEGSDPVAPSAESALAETYPLARPLFLYSAGEPGAAAEAFILFTLSEAGREITARLGFVPPEGGG